MAQDSVKLPPGFVLDEPQDQPANLPAGFQVDSPETSEAPKEPEGPRTILQRMIDMLPSPRTSARVGGGIVGGAIGGIGGTVFGTPIGGVAGAATGGAAGASVGESIYQLFKSMKGEGLSPEEAASGQSHALVEGAVQEGAGPLIEKVAAPMLKSSAVSNIARAVRPSSEGEKAAVKSVAPNVLKEFPVSQTSSALLTKLRANLAEATKKLETFYTAIPATVRFRSTPLKNGLIAERQKLLIQGEITPGTELQAKAFDELITWFDRHPTFNMQELRQNRQLWDNVVNWHRGGIAPEPGKEQVYRKGAGMIRDFINGTYPQTLGVANKQVHSWKELADALERSETRTVGTRAGGYLSDLPVGAGGALIGALVNGPQGAAAGAATGVLLRELQQTALWQTASAASKLQAMSALEKYGVREAIGILAGTAVRIPEMMRSESGGQSK